MKSQKKTHWNPVPICVAKYVGTLVVVIVASLVPGARIWGINWWGHLPAYPIIWLPLVALAVLAWLYRWSSRLSVQSNTSAESDSDRLYFLWSIGLAVLLLASFWLFRGETHFLGDGYQLLARLSSGAVALKSWEASALFLQRVLYPLFEGDPKDRAVATFQLISIVSGGIFLTIAIWGARALFTTLRERLLFLLGLLSGGYLLLFFGYVENYPLFVTAMLAFALVGLLVARGKLNAWWTLPVALVTAVTHIFGIATFPAAFYLLVKDRPWFVKLTRLPATTKAVVFLALTLVGLAAYVFVYTRNYFFRFSVLPLVSDQFTVEGETLLAPRRILDLLNLLMMLVPGLPVLLAAAFLSRTGKRSEHPDLRFLVLLSLAALGETFLFNPRLGLPRDWDLFSFCGVPLATLLFYVVITRVRIINQQFLAVGLAIALGFFILGSRVAVQAIPSAGIAHFRDYLALDHTKCRNARNLLADYYIDHGDSVAATTVKIDMLSRYPEVALNDHAKTLIVQEKVDEAVPLLRQAIAMSPMYFDAYSNLGSCYFRAGSYDEALNCFQIADGLNPHNLTIMNNIAMASGMLGNYARARELFTQVLAGDSSFYSAWIGMAKVYLNDNKLDSVYQMVCNGYRLSKMESNYLCEWADVFVSKEAFGQAAQLYSYALARGLDSAYVRKVQSRYPQLVLP